MENSDHVIPEPFLPETWTEWRLEEQIGGHGGVAVYKAVRNDEAGLSRSAIKRIRIPNGESKKKYIEEIKCMLSLKGHPNIVPIEDYASVRQNGSDYIFIRMELLDPLDQYVFSRDVSEAETVRIGIEICNALEYCQKKNILHLDIKPSNIFVGSEGTYKLGDFGISRTVDELASNPPDGYTPAFMGPELYYFFRKLPFPADNKPVTIDRIGPGYDQYCLGLVLYWIMNNRCSPFLPSRLVTDEDRKNAIGRRMSGETLPPLKKASEALAAIIYKAVSFDPKDRYGSPVEMKESLEKISTRSYNGTFGKTELSPAQGKQNYAQKSSGTGNRTIDEVTWAVYPQPAPEDPRTITLKPEVKNDGDTWTVDPQNSPETPRPISPMPDIYGVGNIRWLSPDGSKDSGTGSLKQGMKTIIWGVLILAFLAVLISLLASENGSGGNLYPSPSSSPAASPETVNNVGYYSEDLLSSDESGWTNWSETRQIFDSADLVQEESRTVFRWWAAQCTGCGTNNPYHGRSSSCHGCGTVLANGQGLWKSVFEYSETVGSTQTIFGRKNGRYFNGLPYWLQTNQVTQYRYKAINSGK